MDYCLWASAELVSQICFEALEAKSSQQMGRHPMGSDPGVVSSDHGRRATRLPCLWRGDRQGGGSCSHHCGSVLILLNICNQFGCAQVILVNENCITRTAAVEYCSNLKCCICFCLLPACSVDLVAS